MSAIAQSLEERNVPHEAQLDLSRGSLGQKAYMDRATQTECSPPDSTPVAPSDSSLIQSLTDKLSDMDISTSSNPSLAETSLETSVVAEDSAYSLEQMSPLASPSTLYSSTTRSFKQAKSPGLTRYVRAQKVSGSSTRLLSLPETVAAYSAKTALAKAPRVVSNPEHLKRRLRTPEDEAHSDQLLDINVGAGSSAHRSAAIDTPRTPSPPSSPDSVVIISNNNHLSESFLRGKSRRPSCSPPDEDDDGTCRHLEPNWMTNHVSQNGLPGRCRLPDQYLPCTGLCRCLTLVVPRT